MGALSRYGCRSWRRPTHLYIPNSDPNLSPNTDSDPQAYAKLHSCYQGIDGGFGRYATVDVQGGHSKSIMHPERGLACPETSTLPAVVKFKVDAPIPNPDPNRKVAPTFILTLASSIYFAIP